MTKIKTLVFMKNIETASIYFANFKAVFGYLILVGIESNFGNHIGRKLIVRNIIL